MGWVGGWEMTNLSSHWQLPWPQCVPLKCPTDLTCRTLDQDVVSLYQHPLSFFLLLLLGDTPALDCNPWTDVAVWNVRQERHDIVPKQSPKNLIKKEAYSLFMDVRHTNKDTGARLYQGIRLYWGVRKRKNVTSSLPPNFGNRKA